jgi:nitroimidazol reductase NimA-like FMN-containing flavoprotein (pyridoxamine 5'-phosphate oxidase superfamily)
VAPSDTAGDRDLEVLARAIVDANRYMTLATADQEGMPWASPVWYASEDYREFFWASWPGTRHSRNISVRPEIAIVIFDSRAAVGAGQALYLEAIAEQVAGDELERGIAVFSRRSEAQGARPWQVVDEHGVVAEVAASTASAPPSRLRLYRAMASGHFVLDPDSQVDERAPVSL